MIREAQRRLANGTNPEPLLKLGQTRDSEPVVSVDLRAAYSGNPSWTDPKALEDFGWEVLRAAGWLHVKKRGQ